MLRGMFRISQRPTKSERVGWLAAPAGPSSSRAQQQQQHGLNDEVQDEAPRLPSAHDMKKNKGKGRLNMALDDGEDAEFAGVDEQDDEDEQAAPAPRRNVAKEKARKLRDAQQALKEALAKRKPGDKSTPEPRILGKTDYLRLMEKGTREGKHKKEQKRHKLKPKSKEAHAAKRARA